MAAKKKVPIRVATVHCNGGCRAVKTENIPACTWGCLGCGECVRICRLQAIQLNEYGVAEVDESKCIGCGLCVRKCPQNVIRIREKGAHFTVLCSNEQPGREARTVCKVSCIACGLCVRKCPAEAITIQNNHAVIDQTLCLACGMCAVNCPRGVIIDKDGILTPLR